MLNLLIPKCFRDFSNLVFFFIKNMFLYAREDFLRQICSERIGTQF